jgi:hypothetical protein
MPHVSPGRLAELISAAAGLRSFASRLESWGRVARSGGRCRTSSPG